jgi:hypothetical protein
LPAASRHEKEHIVDPDLRIDRVETVVVDIPLRRPHRFARTSIGLPQDLQKQGEVKPLCAHLSAIDTERGEPQ